MMPARLAKVAFRFPSLHEGVGAWLQLDIVNRLVRSCFPLLSILEEDRMAARTKTKVSKYKTKYRVKNWAAYDIALRDRGDITVWFDDEAICAWNARPSGRPGGQRRYSDLAIVTALTLRTVFHLPLRQTEGFVTSVIGLMRLALQTPDHTTLSRRHRTVEVPHLPRDHTGPLHLVIDSTGLKI